MWSPEWTQLYWNEKLQKKILGTKINDDETGMIKKYNIKHNTTGNSIIGFPVLSFIMLSACWKKLSKYCEPFGPLSSCSVRLMHEKLGYLTTLSPR